MSYLSLILLIAFLASVALSVYGLVNRKPSVLPVVAGILLMILGGVGATYAWVESTNIPWTIGYCTLSLVGLFASARQTIAFLTMAKN